MAANPTEEGKMCFIDGTNNRPASCSCFRLLKPSFEESDPHCSLDVFPILLEEGSLPVKEKCPFHSSRGQDVYSISVLPKEGNGGPQCTSQLTVLSILEVPILSKKQMCLDAGDCKDCIDLRIENVDAYSPCIVDIDIEKENLETLKSIEETVGSIKKEGVVTHLQKVLQRQSSFKAGGKFLQILMNHGLMLLKFTSKDKSLTDRIHDAPNNRWRKYKRAASFDSRKIVLMFSILSIMGTLVLIYLTLRVRQTGEGFVRA
ncbi:hypothetical protein CFOL_v3_28220 [Cephalotus follicularis]|uniref:Uncharacterized protein n=1 Tax=Cephalotus follicularis TaxID=3775 RepID=A0A1Q3CXH8_CEPFO|nr:hypothetical protein CFOL_v3_28220 [Cephalotus follicularis]